MIDEIKKGEGELMTVNSSSSSLRSEGHWPCQRKKAENVMLEDGGVRDVSSNQSPS